MHRFPFALVLVAWAVPATAGDVSLNDARERRLRGNYAEARSMYEQLIDNDKTQTMDAIGLCRCWRREGK